jgi:pimeloyl-ACP methyl ester carboxylesterase
MGSEIRDGYAAVSDELTVHYQIAGRGPIAVIFVPGWLCTTRFFEHQLTHLATSEDFKAVTYDPRAQGVSTMTPTGHYYEQHARDLEGLIRALGIEHYVLVGWSAGGADVLEFVRLYGADSLRGLILLDTCPRARGGDATKEWIWHGTIDGGDQDDELKSITYDVLVDRAAATAEFVTWMLDDPSPENVKFVTEETMHTSDEVATLLSISHWFLDNTAVVERLDGKVPLLYFTREEWRDLATTWAQMHTPTAAAEAFGKHMMFWEHPDVFNGALDRFLETVRRTAPAAGK